MGLIVVHRCFWWVGVFVGVVWRVPYPEAHPIRVATGEAHQSLAPPSFLSYRGPGLMIQRSASPSSMYAVRARAESGRGTKRDEYLYRMWNLAGAWGELREGLSSQPFSPPYPSDFVAALAAFAHQPDVVLRIAASHPHGDDVVEPYPFSLPAQDASSLISPPHVHPHPGRGQRLPDRPWPL